MRCDLGVFVNRDKGVAAYRKTTMKRVFLCLVLAMITTHCFLTEPKPS